MIGFVIKRHYLLCYESSLQEDTNSAKITVGISEYTAQQSCSYQWALRLIMLPENRPVYFLKKQRDNEMH